jgi:hypothetical protein
MSRRIRLQTLTISASDHPHAASTAPAATATDSSSSNLLDLHDGLQAALPTLPYWAKMRPQRLYARQVALEPLGALIWADLAAGQLRWALSHLGRLNTLL